jgi:eukaryotic-like serine/threonine-protein kinase
MGTARKTLIPFPISRDLTGRSVGRFVVHSKLGAGGMGDVYYAEDTTLRRPVALKRVTNELGSDPHARQRILQEARRASALSSEHIAAVHDVLEENGELFLVMEYVEGETLRQRLQRPITLEQFFEIARQCAEALKAAHEHGIVHCDIKPENIMLTPTGQVKILDFGLAKHLPRSDKSSTLASGLIGGTPAYMAPEVLLEKLPDARSDIFSLGVVLYEMLTLKNPFFTGSFVATSERILHDTPAAIRVLNPNVPEALEAVIMRAMAKTTAQRYANACELLDDLRRAQAGSLPMELTPAVIRGEGRSGKLWLVTAVVLVAVAAFIFATYRWTHRQSVLAERGWVLISDFETAGDEAIPDAGVREGLTIALQQSRYINVFPRSRAYETLQRMKKQGAIRIDEALGREICQRENLRVLLTGSIERMGQTFQISVRGLDPARGNVLFAERERFDRKDQLFDKVDSLAKAVRQDLGESLVGIERSSRPLAKVTTSSLEALQLYSQAQDAKDQGKDQQAPTLLQGAIRLDPDFAMAHMRLGQYYAAVIGRNERALAELERAYNLRQGVTDRERRRIEAAFYDLQQRYDDKAQSLRVLVSLYPDDEEAHVELAGAYYDLGQLDQAILELREVLRLNPLSAPAYGGLVLYLARDNRADAAVAAAREAEQRGVASSRMHWGLGLAYLGQSEVGLARQEFRRIGDATEVDQDLQELCLALADLYEGKLNSARTELAKQIQTVHAQGEGLQSFRRYLLGRIYLIQGNASAAELQADLTLRAPGSALPSNALSDAGTLYVRARKLAKAQQVLRRLDDLRQAIPSTENQNNFHSLEGEILLAKAKPQEAEISFSISAPGYAPFVASTGLAGAYRAEGRWDLSAGQWEKVLDERGEILQNGFPPDLVIAHLELARAYRQMNNRNLALKHYEEVLRLWQHADELTLLREAQHELRELLPEAGHSGKIEAPAR